jgi:hypothetical protein
MITFLNLGKKGNLGNQLFQIASTLGIAKYNDQEVCFPDWEYSAFFDYDFPKLANKKWKVIQEKQFSFYNWNLGKYDYSLNGWLQTERYFDTVQIKEIFKFNTNFKKQVQQKSQDLFHLNPIVISVRRGDFVCNPNYYQLTYRYYLVALFHFFPDFEKRNLIFISDDIEYCKKHFSKLKNAYFSQNFTPIEQLCLCSNFNDFIISNSTFSWWIAWLAEKETSKIIRPIKNFDGAFVEKYNEIDYFPSRWITFDYLKYKLPIKYYQIIIYGEINVGKDKIIYNWNQMKAVLKKKIKKVILK